MTYNLKSIKEEFKKNGVFYTSLELAELVKSYVDIDNIDEVYDPTCGDGGLLCVFNDNIRKYGQEINLEQLQVAKERLINFTGAHGDTLGNPHFMNKKFKCIVANPPFSIKWKPDHIAPFDPRFELCNPILPPKSKADYAFILHVLHYLSDDGVAVCLSFPGILYRGNNEGKIRECLIKNNFIDKVVRIGKDRFVDTKIETAILVFKKNRNKKTTVEFIDTVLNMNRVVELSEIVNNNYNLSVSQYIQKKTVKEYVDAVKLHADARQQMINSLITDIEMDKCICDIEGFDFNQFLEMLQEVIDNMKAKHNNYKIKI